jgi:hypothetical protein
LTAGVPGLGLSGLFVLMSALALPAVRRNGAPRRRVAVLFRLGVIMSVAVIGTWQAISATTFTLIGHGSAGLLLGGWSWPAPIIVISAAVMLLVILASEALLHLVGVRLTPTPPPVPVVAVPERRVRYDHEEET